jgi:hypothetical protein
LVRRADRLGVAVPILRAASCSMQVYEARRRRGAQGGFCGIASACDGADRCAIGTNQRRSISFTTAIETAIRSDDSR